MKIAILSDSHDNIVNISKTLKYLLENNVSIIIHCGDLSAPSILSKVIIPEFCGKIYLVCGNVGDCELLEETAKKYKRVKYFNNFGELKIDNINMAFCHKPDLVRKLVETAEYDYVFYGHTHKPWLQETRIKADRKIHTDQSGQISRQSALLVNPGTLAGLFYKATFAILDTKTKKIELKILERINL